MPGLNAYIQQINYIANDAAGNEIYRQTFEYDEPNSSGIIYIPEIDQHITVTYGGTTVRGKVERINTAHFLADNGSLSQTILIIIRNAAIT